MMTIFSTLILFTILKHSSQNNNFDFNTIIDKYSSKNKFQLDTFYENFKKILNKTAAFDCFESSYHNLNSSQITSKNDFLLISSILVSKLDQCYNANFSLKEPNILDESINYNNTSLLESVFKNILNKTKLIKKEGQ